MRHSYQNREHRGHPYEKEQERLLVGRPAIRILEYDPRNYPGQDKYSWQTCKAKL